MGAMGRWLRRLPPLVPSACNPDQRLTVNCIGTLANRRPISSWSLNDVHSAGPERLTCPALGRITGTVMARVGEPLTVRVNGCGAEARIESELPAWESRYEPSSPAIVSWLQKRVYACAR
jgi:hypothetical protein